MAEVEDVLGRAPDELAPNVMEQGMLMGQALLLRDHTARRFDERTAALLFHIIDLTRRDRIGKVAAALFECGTEAEFLERLQTENGTPSGKKITGRMLWRFPPRQVEREAETMDEVVDHFQLGLNRAK